MKYNNTIFHYKVYNSQISMLMQIIEVLLLGYYLFYDFFLQYFFEQYLYIINN